MLFHDIKQSKEILPLTELQKQMFAAVSLGKCDYTISVRIICGSEIEPIVMEKALYQLMEKQQALHIIFRNTSQKGPVQVVLSDYVSPFYVNSDAPVPSIEKEPWNLSLNTSEKSLLLQYCHIVMDGWSMAIFWKELLNSYKALIETRIPVYRDAKTIKEYQVLLNRSSKEDYNQRIFWENNLSEQSCILADFLRPISVINDSCSCSDTVSVTLAKTLSTKVLHLSSKLRVTPAVIYYAAWMVLLQQLTGQEDISESIVLSGRNSLTDWDGTIGMFIQTVVLSKKMPESFDELCYSIREFLESKYVNSCNAGTACKKALDKKGNNAIADTLIAVENYPMDFNLLTDEKLAVLEYEYSETPSYPFTVLVSQGEAVTISVMTSEHRYRINLKYIINSFIQILEQVSDECNEIKSLEITHLVTITGRWGTDRSYGNDWVLSDIIRNSCKKNHGKTAIIYGNEGISYGDLYDQIINVAANLQEKGVKPSDAVGVAISRSIEQLVSVYAIAMVGAVYIPFGRIPHNRANYMIKQANVKYMIGIEKNLEWDCKWLLYGEIMFPGKEYQQIKQSPDSIAYILFTSGSTGKPKGCSICQKSIINRLIWNMQELNLDSEVHQIFKTPVTFDVSLVEIFALFFSGHSLFVLPENEEKMPDRILDFIEKYQITYAHFVPSMLKSLLSFSEEFGINRKLKTLKTLVCSGEILPASLVKKALCVFSANLRMVNLYGPTEAAVDVSFYNCTLMNNLPETPIGRPIDNTGLLVLNPFMKELPVGVEGELYILGRNVGAGYVNNTVLTDECFITLGGKTAFRTGDMAYRLESGDIVVTGRSDGQIKYNGVRIETSEIEHHIIESGFTNSAFVFLDKKDAGTKLVACCCCDAMNENEIRRYLQNVLPKNMLPSCYFFLKEFPLTIHGKTDFKQLKKMFSKSVVTIDKKEDATILEKELSKIWNTILSTEIDYSADDHFFEVGGTSLLLIQLLIDIKKRWNVKIETSMIYENPTIEEISNLIRNSKTKIHKSHQLHGITEASQKSIYFSQSNNPQSTAYNMPVLVELKDSCSFEQAENAFYAIVSKYEWLHKKYVMKDGELTEYVGKEPFTQPDTIFCNNESDISNLVKPFDMDHSLYRMSKVLYQGKRYVYFDFHHILCDQNVIKFLLNAWCLALSHDELENTELIMDFTIHDVSNSMPVHYWEKKWEGGGWLAFSNLVPLNREKEGKLSRHYFDCNQKVIDRIEFYCRSHRCSKFQFLLSAFSLFCMKAFNCNRLSLGTNTTADSFNYHNMQLQVLVLGVVLEKEMSFDLFLKRMVHELAEGMKHGGTTVDGLYDIMFIREEEIFENELLQTYVNDIRPLNKQTKNPLSLFYKEKNNKMQFCFDYDESLFEADAIALYGDLYLHLINEIIDCNQLELGKCSLLSAPQMDYWKNGQKGTCKINNKHSIQEQFVEWFEKHPNDVVIRVKDEQITAKQFLRKCNGCAKLLRNYKSNNNLVGICIKDEFKYITSVFGTLMAGYTFVPFDPEHPDSHIHRICESYQISILITDEPDRFAKACDTIFPCFEEMDDSICISSKYAYCIFTSGSTGQPKGCFISQGNVINYLTWANDFYCKGEKHCFAFYGSPAVDMTITSTLLPLVYGHKLVIFPNRPESVRKIFNDSEITVAKMTPTHLRLLDKQSISTELKVLIVGGEQLTSGLAKSILMNAGENLNIYNEYGPTEATVGSMIYRYNPADTYTAVPIGKPINNMKSYIVGEDGNICLPGVIGELVIEGESVIEGYIDDKERTAQKFQRNGDCWKYYTGDLARMLSDGNMMYEGRVDEQYKINGFRIELAEIGAVAEEIENIDHAQAVMAKGHLVLFCVPKKGKVLSELTLRRKLFDVLPKHMIPARIIMVDSLPLEKSGKVHKKALIEQALLKNDLLRDSMDKKEEILLFVRECWKAELSHSDFENEDGFFEVGGNSISIVSLKERLSEKYDFITVADLFCYPSVRTQVEYIFENNNDINNDSSVEPVTSNKEVAIIGIGLRLVDVHDLSGVQRIFEKGIECGRTVRGQRKEDVKKQLRELGIPDTDYRFAKTASLDRIDLFDYEYFKIGKDEACAMDPAQRLLLSVTDDAIVDAGLSTQNMRGMNCAVIFSTPTDVGFNSYLSNVYPIFKQNAPLNAVNSSIAGRIQHFYDLHGPAYMVDSACSSGLVAMHNACLSIRNNECDMAIVGGVNILDTVDYVGCKKADVLSSHYYAAPFSREAEGTSRGEGCICFVLEDLDKAVLNNHHIYGKIKGSAVNNDGFASSLTAPNGLMQETVLKRAWKNAGITASDINIMETHGTATKLGDQIELQALMNVMKNSSVGRCALSSAKAVLGHLDSVSGLLGVLKSLISMQTGYYYPTNDYREPMEGTDIISSAFFIPNEIRKINGSTVICGVSSFGLSGTNVHVVLEGKSYSKSLENKIYHTNQNPVRCWVPDEPEQFCKDKTTQQYKKTDNVKKTYSQNDVLQKLSEKVASLYGDDLVDPEMPLLRMGFDSVSVIQLRLFMQSTFDMDIDVSAQNTLTEIAEHICANGKVHGKSTEKQILEDEFKEDDTEKVKESDNSSWYHLQIRSSLKEFIKDYCNKTASSREQLLEKDIYWANGRFMTGYTLGLGDLSYPVLVASANGAQLIDVDGNVYIDFAMGFGSTFFGYNHPYIAEKVKRSLADEVILGALMKKPFEVAARICKTTGLERVSFCNSGTEAIMNLIRIARAVRNRNKVVVFTGSFHGTFDPVYVEKNYWKDDLTPAPRSIGTPLHYLDDIIMLSYGTADSLEYIKNHADQLAAVVIEPVQSRHPDLQPKEFVQRLRKITNDTNVLLIFDEVITGFRSGLKGAQGFYDVKADLVSYGKVIGGGYPIGVFGGKAEYLDYIDHRGALTPYGDTGKWVSTGGTFNGHPISITAADAVLDLLEKDGEKIYKRINMMTDYIADTLNHFFEAQKIDFRVEHFCSQFFIVGNDILKLRMLQYLMIYRNIYIWEGGTCFVSAVHTWEHIYKFVDTVKECVLWMKVHIPEKDEINVTVDEKISGKDYKTLKKLVEKYPSIREIQTLSNELRLILTHNIANRSKRKDCASIKLYIPKKVEVKLLQKGISVVVNAHRHLKSGVSWRRLTKPVQLFYNFVSPRHNFYEFNNMIDYECVETVIQKRREIGFDLEDAPLVMFDSFHGTEETILAITYYNSWFDGWSLDILLKQLQSYISGKPIGNNSMNWEKYSQWKNHEREKVENYWKQRKCLLPSVSKMNVDTNKWYMLRYPLNEKMVSSISLYCNKKSISKASAYIYCLAKTLKWKTALVDFSGRNIPVDGILNEIGLFSRLAPIVIDNPVQINQEIQEINAMPLLTLGEIADCMGEKYEQLFSMTYMNTIVVLNQDTTSGEMVGNILDDKSYVHVPLRFYITVDKELLITANSSVFSKEEAECLICEFEREGIVLEKENV